MFGLIQSVALLITKVFLFYLGGHITHPVCSLPPQLSATVELNASGHCTRHGPIQSMNAQPLGRHQNGSVRLPAHTLAPSGRRGRGCAQAAGCAQRVGGTGRAGWTEGSSLTCRWTGRQWCRGCKGLADCQCQSCPNLQTRLMWQPSATTSKRKMPCSNRQHPYLYISTNSCKKQT